jgi:hypothetical protein
MVKQIRLYLFQSHEIACPKPENKAFLFGARGGSYYGG